MYWVRPVLMATSLLISAIAIGYAAFHKRQQNRSVPIQGYTFDNQREKKKRQCGICLKEMNSSVEITLPCNHSFCLMCLIPLFAFGTQTSCCECRRELESHDLNVLKRKLLD